MLGYSYSPFTRLAPYCVRRARDCHGRASRLFSVVVLHCLRGGSQRLWFSSNVCNVLSLLVAPRTTFVLLLLSVTYSFVSGLSIIYFVGVYGKGFPVDSSSCIYLYFPFRPLSRRGISYFAWQVCGWSCTRETWVDGFFPGAGLEKNRGWGFFFTIAGAASSLCSQ